MKHFLAKDCFKKSKWNNDTLLCPCGKKIAVRYMLNKEVKIFIYGKFKKYKQAILNRQDTQTIAGESDLLGHLDNQEWEDILCEVRQNKINT